MRWLLAFWYRFTGQLSDDWWRELQRREFRDTPEAAHWQWSELQKRER